jgi:hypothetical protein
VKVSHSLACGVAALFLVACGGSSDTEPGASEATSTSTGASSGAGAGNTTGAGSGGSSADGGGAADDRIDPISVGHDWTYDVTEIGDDPACPSGSHTGKTLSEGTFDGKDAFQVSSLCTGYPPSYYAVDGDVVEVNYMGTWLLALDAPVQEGHMWTNGASTFTWHDEGTVTVGAGTFEQCFRATQDDAGWDAYTIFCRGVGPVHWHSVDPSGDGYDAVLTAVSF